MARNQRRQRPHHGERQKPGSLSWVLIVVAVALVVTVAFAFQRRRAARQVAVETAQLDSSSQEAATPVSTAIMSGFESIPAATWTKVGLAGASLPVFVGDSVSSGGKPVVLYMGAGYCPYCAAARWSMIASLSRFGSFSGLTLSASSSVDVYPSTPTFSFHGSTFTSQYIDLQTVEFAGTRMLPNGRYEPLEKATPAQDALIGKYDAPPYVDARSKGGIPFILVGGRYMWSGSPFSPAVLADKTQAAIAATLPSGQGAAASQILANANELTATICAVDGNQPSDVCSDPTIQKAVALLPVRAP